MKNESSEVSIANEINSEKWRKQYINSFNSSEKQSLQKNARESVGYLTTREDLVSLQNLKAPTRETNIEINVAKNVKPFLPKACKYSKFKLEEFEKIP